ncbi:serine hydrolase [Lacticaseibacillus saniviri]
MTEVMGVEWVTGDKATSRRAALPPRRQSMPSGPKRPKWGGVMAVAVIALVVILGGIYVVVKPYANQSSTREAVSIQVTRSAKQTTSSQKISKATTSSKISATSSSKRATSAAVTWNQAAVRADINRYITPLAGTNSVYVTPMNASQPLVINNRPQRAASTIKLFILATAYAKVSRGQFNLDQHYTLQETDKVGGTGVLGGQAAGTILSYRDLLNDMITQSDNTATNIIINLVGGMPAVNAEIRQLGARDSQLNRKMMDTAKLAAGVDNVTSVQDVGHLLQRLYRHQLISADADTQMLNILQRTQNHSKLPASLPATATVYNKTGEFGDYGVQNDAAIIADKKGAFVAVVMCQNGNEAAQISAMRQLGSALYRDLIVA